MPRQAWGILSAVMGRSMSISSIHCSNEALIQPARCALVQADSRTGTAGSSSSGKSLDFDAAAALVDRMNRTLNGLDTSLEFSVHQGHGEIVVRVIDNVTGNLIRQFPSDHALAIADALEYLQGALLRDQA